MVSDICGVWLPLGRVQNVAVEARAYGYVEVVGRLVHIGHIAIYIFGCKVRCRDCLGVGRSQKDVPEAQWTEW